VKLLFYFFVSLLLAYTTNLRYNCPKVLWKWTKILFGIILPIYRGIQRVTRLVSSGSLALAVASRMFWGF
jgi:hypothetical protein